MFRKNNEEIFKLQEEIRTIKEDHRIIIEFLTKRILILEYKQQIDKIQQICKKLYKNDINILPQYNSKDDFYIEVRDYSYYNGDFASLGYIMGGKCYKTVLTLKENQFGTFIKAHSK